MKYVVLVVTFCFAACAGAPKPTTQSQPLRPKPEPVVEEEAPPARPSYVIVHRNTRLRLQPSDDAPYLQYRTPEQERELRQKWDEEYAEADASWLESHEEWWEDEKERRQKLRKRLRRFRPKKRAEIRERDLERQDARVDAHYVERLDELRKRARKRRMEAPHRAWIPFQLIKQRGDWIELSPVDQTAQPPHCYRGNFGQIDRLQAKFFVRASELEQVTTDTVTIQPMDGTKVVLKPGVAVRPLGSDGRYSVYVGAFELKLDVPSSAIGTEYEPAVPFEAPVTNMVFTPFSQARDRLRLGPGQPLPYNPYRPLYITGTVGVGSRFYATTQTPCGEYTVRLSKDYIEPAGKRGVMRLSADDDSVSPPYARTGAMAHLRDGEPFARVRRDYPLSSAVEPSGDRECYRTVVWGRSTKRETRNLELCFNGADVVRE